MFYTALFEPTSVDRSEQGAAFLEMGDQFLALSDPNKEVQPSDGDVINLWNPPSCAPDFTKNYNVTAIVMKVL